MTAKINYQKEIVSNDFRGLDVYSKPNIFQISEDKKCFYYSEIGILANCKYYAAADTTNPKHSKKFILHIQYDYRSPDDLNNFGFVRNTGTYGTQFYLDTLEEAIEKTLEFINSDFIEYKTFAGEKINPIKKATVKEVAKSQSLHHLGMFFEHQKEDSIYLTIIKNAGEYNTLLEYKRRNEDRHKANLKFEKALKNRFLKDFNIELESCVYRFRFSLYEFKKFTGITDFEAINDNQKNTLKHIFKYYK
jgi:hypothetical protein